MQVEHVVIYDMAEAVFAQHKEGEHVVLHKEALVIYDMAKAVFAQHKEGSAYGLIIVA